jgi:hypothetical protein
MNKTSPQTDEPAGGYISQSSIETPESLHLRPEKGKDMVYPFPGIIGHLSLTDEQVLSFLAQVVMRHGQVMLDKKLSATERIEVAQAVALSEWISLQNGADNDISTGSSRALEMSFGLPALKPAAAKGGRK